MKSRQFLASVALTLGLAMSFGCQPPTRGPAQRLTSSTPAVPQKASKGFTKFCGEWLSKLETRHRKNEQSVQYQRKGHLFVGEFTGYGRRPLSCSARPTGDSRTPLVGRLGYHEIRYQKAGGTKSRARKSSPRELYRIEVTELFRYDGSSWRY